MRQYPGVGLAAGSAAAAGSGVVVFAVVIVDTELSVEKIHVGDFSKIWTYLNEIFARLF